MVSLKGCRPLALGQDDQGIKDFVELANVEDPAPKRKTLVPKSANIRGIRVAARSQVNERVLGLPNVDRGVVGRSVSESSWAV